jgi:hypothetical protein
VLDDLTDDESELVAAARDGRVLDCSANTRIRAGLIRELLLGRHGDLDPRGVRLHGARVVGPLELEYVTSPVGLELVDCDVEERMSLSRAVLPRLQLTKSRLDGLHAPGVQVAGDVLLDEATVSGTGELGAVRLRGAHVGGMLILSGAEVHNDSGPAVHADSLRVADTFFLRGARLFGHGDRGAVRLIGAHIAGELNMQRVELSNDSGPALDAASLTVGNVFLENAAVVGHGAKGAIRLRGARIGGMLTLKGTDVRNDLGPALGARRLAVASVLRLDGATLSGSGEPGTVWMESARLSNDCYAVDAEITNDTGPALHADGIQVEGTIVLLRSRISGVGDGGAVWLLGAHVGGIRFVDTELNNDSGAALFADQLQAHGLLLLQRMRLRGDGNHAALRLASARVEGQFSLMDTTIDNPSGPLLDVNGFTFGSLAGVDWRHWLNLIRNHTKEYRPSPYQALAAVERAAGHDGNARNILIAQQQDLRHRAPETLGGWLARRFHWLWGALAGYGYRARRTALALLLALLAAGGVALWAGHVPTGPGRYAAEHTITSAAPRTPCSTVELVGLGLDRGLPLGPTGLRSRCDLDTETTAGQVFTVSLWIVQAAVWGLATLAIAGYTGLIRKTA